MILTIKYFGLITDITKRNEESFEFSGDSINELINALNVKYPELKSKDFQIAQDMVIVNYNSKITGTEIALLPPFSGG